MHLRSEWFGSKWVENYEVWTTEEHPYSSISMCWMYSLAFSFNRERTSHWKLKDINSTEQRYEGNCPLTPNEVGIFLRAMGYPESTWIYLAAGEIYGGEKYISKLRSYFPNLVSKVFTLFLLCWLYLPLSCCATKISVFQDMLATEEELAKFSNHASQVAALDYIIAVESDVFIPSHSGNMAKAVEGHRRFLGHRKTITPDR